jgi:hypothetical protein
MIGIKKTEYIIIIFPAHGSDFRNEMKKKRKVESVEI